MKKLISNRTVSLFLVLAMLFACLPVNAFAEGESYCIEQIISCAKTVVTHIELNKKIPDTVTIAGDKLYTSKYYALMLAAVVSLYENDDIQLEIAAIDCDAAPDSQEKLAESESVSKVNYAAMAQKAYDFCVTNGRAPNHSTTPKNNRVSYQGMIYAYSRVLVFYANNQRLPETLTHSSWSEFSGEDINASTPTPKPTPKVTPTPNTKPYTIEQISAAAISLERSIKKDKTLPPTAVVAGDEITLAQYMNLAFRAVVNISNGSSGNIYFKDITGAPSPAESDSVYEFYREDYVSVAGYSVNFIDKNGRLANYFTAENSRLGANEAIYAYIQILSSYAQKGTLPEVIRVVPWKIFASFEETETSTDNEFRFEQFQITTAAKRVAAAVEKFNKIPISVTVSNKKIYPAGMLSLFADAILDMESGVYESASIKFLAPKTSNEKLSSGTLSKNEYLVLASDVIEYMMIEGMAPESMLTKLGYISFENLIFTFARILSNSNSALAGSVSVTTWESITGETLELPKTEAVYTPVPTFVPSDNSTINRSRKEKAFDLNSIVVAAQRLESTIKNLKRLPNSVIVDGEKIALPEFLMLMMNTVLYINGNILVDVEKISADNPEGDGENIKNGTVISKEEIVSIAKEAVAYTKNTKLAPSYVSTTGGAMGFKTSLYFFASIVANFAEQNYILPKQATVITWESITSMKLPQPMQTVEIIKTPAPTPYNGIGVMEGDEFGTSGVGEYGAVASSSKYASKIGLDILKAGGNAIDAAVATIFAVGLCEPSGSSIGGGGITVIYLAEEDKYITMDYMVGGTGKGPAGVPGIPKGAALMLEKYGTMTLQEVLAPVIKLAHEGFAVTNTFCKKSKLVGNTPGTYLHELFRKDGEYLVEGDIFKNEDLGNVLQAISDNGIDYFYDSEFTDELCAYLQKNGCTITRDDFASYEAFEDVPRVGEYRGHTIYAGSGTATGGASVLAMLDKMDNYDLALIGHDHSETVRITATSFGIRPASSLNEKLVLSYNELTEDVDWFDTKSTTMLVTRDKDGNMVASNNTLGANFGSEIAMPGTGFCMSSRNCAVGERVSSTMSPCIVAHFDGTPMLGVGSPGNSAIITATAITISNMLDFDMTVAEAIHAPRLYGSGSAITIEARYSPWVLDELTDMGFSLYAQDEFSDGVGCVSAIHVDEDGTVYSSADIRREYMSYAY